MSRPARSGSMRHQVKDDVDAKGIGHLLGVLVEVKFVLTLSFPTIADVAVVDGNNHHPLVIVEQGPDVHFLGAFATVDPLERIYRGEGSEEMHIRALLDDHQRMMIIAIHNSDISDGWEREGENELYFNQYSEKVAYPLGINIIFYLMTH